MPLRFRRLTGRINWDEFGKVWSNERQNAEIRLRGSSLMSGAVALASTPKQVSATEGEAEPAALAVMLQKSLLKPTDLVEGGEGWRTFGESMEFSDVCLEVKARRRRRALLAALVALGIASLGIAGFAYQVREARRRDHAELEKVHVLFNDDGTIDYAHSDIPDPRSIGGTKPATEPTGP